MSTGISISSINRIKELAEEKKFAEALEILDTQNLDKSINPQFLRISGEIFRENKRYYDSRRILLKAHQMAPQGTRIIYELIQLYLELGYYTKAQRYYEQYLFYSSSEDTQRDYVEYSMKKALGSDIKELASILIPILERMPEDKWNFEAVLLYDKMDRKDKALDESRYILENFKDSVFVQPVIDYIDDKLDVDQHFYIYPKEEQEEDIELFGDLIKQEDKLLEADYLRMHPPEARIMVEVEDKDAIESRPVKEKKSKKRKKKTEANLEDIKDINNLEADSSDGSDKEEKESIQKIIKAAEQLVDGETETATVSEEEKQLKEEREAALEKLLSKKIDADKIKESAKQVAKAVREIDTEKTKQQMKSVAESVKDNVKKATDVLGEAVGTKQEKDSTEIFTESNTSNEEDQIVDGIIESILEPPKKVVGQVVMNEELDALIPDSLEAMSEEEIADIEAKREEAERLELEALEAALQFEEQKKLKGKQKKSETTISDEVGEMNTSDSDIQTEQLEKLDNHSVVSTSYAELKEKYLAELEKEEEKPLDSLGFISVVHSDVDSTMDEEIPYTAEMLHQMIDNKEFYAGEDSTGFESKASYSNHGFEVEDYEFDSYRESDYTENVMDSDYATMPENEDVSLNIEEIYAKEQIVDFDEIVPEDMKFETSADTLVDVSYETPVVEETAITEPIEEPIVEEPVEEEAEELVVEEPVEEEAEELVVEETVKEEIAEPIVEETVDKQNGLRRNELRVSIILTDKMINMLMDLKESR